MDGCTVALSRCWLHRCTAALLHCCIITLLHYCMLQRCMLHRCIRCLLQRRAVVAWCMGALQLRVVCQKLHRIAGRKFPDSKFLAVGGFFFLR